MLNRVGLGKHHPWRALIKMKFKIEVKRKIVELKKLRMKAKKELCYYLESKLLAQIDILRWVLKENNQNEKRN